MEILNNTSTNPNRRGHGIGERVSDRELASRLSTGRTRRAHTTPQPILFQGTPAGLQETTSASTYADSAPATVVPWGTPCLSR